jgi:glycosyltransferase involved in cell wall biosynthesis
VNVDWFFLSHRLPLALEGIKRGYEVTLFSVDTGKRSIIESYGIRFIDLHFHRSNFNLVQELKSFLTLYKHYRSEKPEIVHHVTLKAIFLGTIVARLAGINNVINAFSGLGYLFIDTNKDIKKTIITRVFKNLFNKNSYKLIFQNFSDQETIESTFNIISPTKYIIKGSGINLKDYVYLLETNTDKTSFIFPARLLKDKGIYEYSIAAGEVNKLLPEKANFYLYGMIDVANKTGLSKNEIKILESSYGVIYKGYSNNMKAVYEECNVVVLPSYREGLPKSLIEACAIGRAIITTNVPGCRDVVVDNVNGLLVPLQMINPLVKAMIQMIENREMRIKMGREGRKIAEQEFNIEAVIERTYEIYLY